MVMISFEHVTKRYRKADRPALDDISLDVDKGDFVFVVGASGSGKSTLIRLILKEERLTSGDIHVLGYDLRAISSRRIPFYRRNLGVVFQDFRLLPNKTAAENVAFALEVTGKSAGYIQEAVPDVLRLVGLDGKGDAMPHELSGGEQQRVAIARAVVTKPAILLADEPTGNLDPETSSGIMSVIEKINAGGTTVIMATHDTSIVNRMRRRVVELDRGRLVRDERGGGYQDEPERRAAERAAATARATAGPRPGPGAARPPARPGQLEQGVQPVQQGRPVPQARSIQPDVARPGAEGTPAEATAMPGIQVEQVSVERVSVERDLAQPQQAPGERRPAGAGVPRPAGLQPGARPMSPQAGVNGAVSPQPRPTGPAEPRPDGFAPPRTADQMPPRVDPQTVASASETPTSADVTLAQPATERIEVGLEEDIQVIATESQPLTERLGLVGGGRPPAPRTAPQTDADDEGSEAGR